MERWEVHGILGGDLSAHSMPQQGVQLHPDVILASIFPCPNMKEHDTSQEDIKDTINCPEKVMKISHFNLTV